MIITALAIETKKVCDVFDISQRVKKDSRVYWCVDLPLKNGSSYKVVVAQCTGMGNVSSSNLTSDVFHHWSPSAVLMVGVAGASRKEQNLGDIVVGRAVHYYEFGKVIDGSYKEECSQYLSDATLWNHLQTLPSWGEPIITPRPDNRQLRPNIHKGVIASGEKRISDAVTRDAIAALDKNIVAIEMEGYGVFEVAWQKAIKCLVIRSICDMADANEDNRWHLFASEVAASFTKHFLLDCPLAPIENRMTVGDVTGTVSSSHNNTSAVDNLDVPDFIEIANLFKKSGRATSSARKSICYLINVDPGTLQFIDGTSDEDFSIQLLANLEKTSRINSIEKLCNHLRTHLYGENKERLEREIMKLKNAAYGSAE